MHLLKGVGCTGKHMQKDTKVQKPRKYFHSENESYLKLTRESSILILLIILGRKGSWIFPLAPHAAFLSSLGGDHVSVSPLHTIWLWSVLAHDVGFGVALSTDSFIGRYPTTTENFFYLVVAICNKRININGTPCTFSL